MGFNVENSTSTAWATLGYALAYNLGALVLVALAYNVGHTWRVWHRMIAPRNAVGERGGFVKPLTSLLATIRQVVGATEEEVVLRSGTDAAAYVRFFTLCLQMYIIFTVIVFPILIGFYSQGGNPAGVTGINQLSLATLLDQSTVIWVSLVMLYFVTFTLFYLLWRHTAHVLYLRHHFLAHPQRALEPHNYATVVMCIPPAEEEGSARKRPPALTPGDFLNAVWEVGTFLQALLPCFSRDGHMKNQRRKARKEAEAALATEESALLAAAAAGGGATPPASSSQGTPGAPGERVVSGQGQQGGGGEEGGVPGAAGLVGGRSSGEGTLTVDGSLSQGCGRGSLPRDLDAECAAMGTSLGVEYLQPGEVPVASHIRAYFHDLFGDQVLHLQPVYSESDMVPAFQRWRHAIRMLNEARMRWEMAREAAESRRQAGLQTGPASKAGERADPGVPQDHSESGAKLGSGEGQMGAANGSSGASVRKLESPRKDLMPRHKINKKWLFFGGEEVESIPYWIEEVQAAAENLRQAQATAMAEQVPSAVIAIFKSRKGAAMCRVSLKGDGQWSWKGMQAAPVQEMWWDNLRFNAGSDSMRTAWATLMTIAMVVLFYIPVTLIASLASGDRLSPVFTAQKTEVKTTWLPPQLQAIVPSLALHSVLWIFSPVFMLIARWEGRISLGDAMIVSSSRFYYVVIVNVLIAYSLSTSLTTAIGNVIEGQTTVWELLAAGLPANAAFYIQYTLNSSLMCGMELGRLPIHICAYLVKVWAFGMRMCDRERHWDQGPMAYHVFIGYSNLIMTYGIVFSVVAPLILPFSLLYTVIAHFTWKHELLHTYRDPVDRGGVYWLRLVHHLLNALFIGQLTTVGIFSMKKAYTQMGLAIPSMFLTLMAYIWLDLQYGSVFKAQPLSILVKEDSGPEKESPLMKDPKKLASYYFPPFMVPPVLPNLDPLAPSDPDIWHYMHPTRCLFKTNEYFPTPPARNASDMDDEAKPLLAPDDPSERAFWEITQVIPPLKRASRRRYVKGEQTVHDGEEVVQNIDDCNTIVPHDTAATKND